MKLDLYRIHLPHLNNSMIVGVDVIMNGINSLVGCCATSTKTLSKCFTKLFK